MRTRGVPRTGCRTLYVSGELRLGRARQAPIEDLMRYRPAWMSGSTLILHYARREDLEPYRSQAVAEGEAFVQVWLREGDPPVTLAAETPVRHDPIPESLRPFL